MEYLLVGVALAAMLASCVRTVPEEQRLVIRRSGGRVRVAGPGLAFAIPLLESTTSIAIGLRHLVLSTKSRNSDGLITRLQAEATIRISDVSRYTPATSAAAADAIEDALHHDVATRSLSALPGAGDLLQHSPSMPAGIELVRIRISGCQVEVTPELRRLVQRSTIDERLFR